MKKLKKSLNKEYLTSRLFLDDLEEIENILVSARNFEIKTEDYAFSNVAELKQHYLNQKLNSVQISIFDPYITVDLKKMWIRLYCSSDEDHSVGIFTKIDKILSKSTLKPNWLYSIFLLNILSVLFLSLQFFFKEKQHLFVLASYILLLWVLWVVYLRLQKSSLIQVQYRRDTKNIFTKNLDQIIIGVVISILSILATLYIPELLADLKFL